MYNFAWHCIISPVYFYAAFCLRHTTKSRLCIINPFTVVISSLKSNCDKEFGTVHFCSGFQFHSKAIVVQWMKFVQVSKSEIVHWSEFFELSYWIQVCSKVLNVITDLSFMNSFTVSGFVAKCSNIPQDMMPKIIYFCSVHGTL